MRLVSSRAGTTLETLPKHHYDFACLHQLRPQLGILCFKVRQEPEDLLPRGIAVFASSGGKLLHDVR